MSVTVSMTLFGHPGHELEEGVVRGADLRNLADSLAERLREAAQALDRLSATGWTAHAAMFDLLLSHPEVVSREQAEQRLVAAGVDLTLLMIVEEVEEGELDD
jgi:hypothetical protein